MLFIGADLWSNITWVGLAPVEVCQWVGGRGERDDRVDGVQGKTKQNKTKCKVSEKKQSQERKSALIYCSEWTCVSYTVIDIVTVSAKDFHQIPHPTLK